MSEKTVPQLNSYDKTLIVPPDKSISVRAVVLCSYAVGNSTVRNISLCDDVLSAVDCMKHLGAKIDIQGNTAFITGAPFRSCALDCGNSATTARLLMGLLSGLNGVFEIDGDSSLRTRPMKRVIDPLRIMGARIADTDGHLPVRIIGSPLRGMEYFMPISSAQVKSALLLAGLNCSSAVTVTEKIKTRNHTEIMLNDMNGDVALDGNTVKCAGGIIFGNDITVCGDISAAAYPIALALAVGGSCTVKNVGLNPTRTGFLDIVRKIGGRVSVDNRTDCAEPYGDISVSGGKLRPIIIGENEVPLVIDEIPALCALACHIDGVSVIEGAGELRHKESDRISCTVAALKSLGAQIEETDSGMIIYGGKPLKKGTVNPQGDHRIAMAAAVAGAAGAGAVVQNAECVSVSYPSFFEEVLGV
ncbi:MAG: 3-phosphoshikimate 1-carboxyvinyltransferase [Clostridiales bacterium]|nr:3-phosphoshikimate 1-carboxyvinyltransferase [Clostridiales bacterium]